MHGTRRLTYLALTILLAACTSVLGRDESTEEARRVPEAERASVLVRSQWWLVYASDIEVISVDGFRGGGWGTRRVEIAPGRHSIVISSWVMFAGMGGDRRVQFDLNAQAGTAYEIRSVDIVPAAYSCLVEIEVRRGETAESKILLPCRECEPGASWCEQS